MTQPDPIVAQTATAALGAATITAQISAATTTIIQALWRQVNPYNPREVGEFAKRAGRLLVSSQRTVANAHTAAQQVQLQAMGINRPVSVTIPDDVRGAAVDFGRTPKVKTPAETTIDYGDGAETVRRVEAKTDRVLERAAEKYRYERSTGKDAAAANDAAQQRISDIVDSNLLLSARLASQQALVRAAEQDERIIGYRRIIHPELSKGGVCGMCVAAADRRYKVSDLQPIHARCNCTIAPVTTTHDPGLTLNQDDLDRLYEHAAHQSPDAVSTSAAALKRPRYQIVHHHEYGPVLTRITGEQVPYFSTTPPQAA